MDNSPRRIWRGKEVNGHDVELNYESEACQKRLIFTFSLHSKNTKLGK